MRGRRGERKGEGVLLKKEYTGDSKTREEKDDTESWGGGLSEAENEVHGGQRKKGS